MSRRLGAPHRRSAHCGVTVLTYLSRCLGTLNLVVSWYRRTKKPLNSVVYNWLIFQHVFLLVYIFILYYNSSSLIACAKHLHVIILFFVYFHWNALIRLTCHTFHFTLQTSTFAVQHGSKNYCKHVEYFGNLLYILCCYL